MKQYKIAVCNGLPDDVQKQRITAAMRLLRDVVARTLVAVETKSP